jgi:hypothetical protein
LSRGDLLLALRQSLLGGGQPGRALLELRPLISTVGDLRLDGREPVALGAEHADPAAQAALPELELPPLTVELGLPLANHACPLAQALLQRIELLVGLDGALPLFPFSLEHPLRH